MDRKGESGMAGFYKKWVAGGLAGLLLLGMLWALLPGYLERRLVRMAAEAIPGATLSLEVRRLGLSGADLAALKLSSSTGPILVIDSIRVDYSLLGLFAGHVERIVLAGVQVDGQLKDNALVIPGLAGLVRKEAPRPAQTGVPQSPLLSWTFSSLAIENGLLRCRMSGGEFLVPVAGTIVQQDPVGIGDAAAALHGELRVSLAGEELRCGLKFLPRSGQLDVAMHAKKIRLGALTFPEETASRFLLSGAADLQGRATLRLSPLQLGDFDLAMAVDGLEARAGGFTLRGPGTEPLHLAMHGNHTAMEGRLNGVVLSGGLAAEMKNFAGTLEFGVEGPLATLAWHGSVALPGGGEESLLGADASVVLHKEKNSSWRLDGRITPTTGDTPLAYDSILLTGKGDPLGHSTVQAEMGNLRWQKNGISATLPRLVLRGDSLATGNGAGQRKIELSFSQGSVDMASGVVASGFSGTVPLSWPPVEKEGAGGEITMDRLLLNGNDLGGVRLAITQQGRKFILAGSHKSLALEGATLDLQGQLGLDAANVFFADLGLRIRRHGFTAFDLGRYAGYKDEITMTGEIEGGASLQVKGKNRKGELSVQLHDGRLDMPTRKATVQGINFSLAMPDLLSRRSADAQQLTFAEARLGDLLFQDGRVVYQLLSPDTLFVEGLSLSWSGGRVYSQPLRLKQDRRNYDLVLFCDRLKLSRILEQFGVQDAEGEGTVSGRIPLLVADGKLQFGDGFLFSSPGEGGVIKVRGLDALTAGLPKNSPQFAQLDFAGEALRNFQYNWVKLLLVTEAENLVLQMKLDGQPAQPIPFKYDRALGTFSRLEVGSAGGIRHPIRLDMNLRMPLDKVLGYSGSIRQLYERTQ